MRRVLAKIVVPSWVLLAACGSEAPAGPDAGVVLDAAVIDGGAGDAGSGDGGLGPPFLTTLSSLADLALLGSGEQGVKYLFPVEGRAPVGPLTEACYFQNMRRHPWHLQFLQSFPELSGMTFDAYLSLVMRRASRAFFGGAVRIWPGVPHPDGALGVMTLSIYAEPSQLTVEDVIAAHAALVGCAPFAASFVAYLPEDAWQKSFARQAADRLEAAGVAVVFPEELAAGLTFEAYSNGEGYGTLRIVPRGRSLESYSIRDVVIVEAAPAELSLVAGLITADRQSLHSHANLRLIEKQIPNAAVPRIYDDATVRALDGLLVHLVVSADGVTIEPARLEDAEEFWARTRPVVPAPRADLTITEPRPFDSLRSADAIAYGVKAANLGELHRALDQGQRPDGFGIPFSHYHALAEGAGVPAELERMLNDPRLATDAVFKRDALRALRQRIRNAPIPEAGFEAITRAIEEVFGASAATTPIKLRSSTNVEDLERISGAGLYESKRGCLADDRDGDLLGPSRCLSAEEAAHLRTELDARRAELAAHPERAWLLPIIENIEGDLTEEKPVADALRKVWASLWTERAFDERAYYGIDHRLVYMGLAVNASFVLERANAVAVTHAGTSSAGLPVRLVSQVGDEEVVAPADPTSVPELLTFAVTSTGGVAELRRLVGSSRVPEGEAVWPAPALEALARAVRDVQLHFEQEVYPSIRPLRLDLELKHTRDGRVSIKQARPFVGNF